MCFKMTKVMNKRVARVLMEIVEKNLNKDFCLELLWTLFTHFIEDDRINVRHEIKSEVS